MARRIAYRRVHDEEGHSDEEQSSEGSSAPALDEAATAQDRLPDTAASLITDQAVASLATLIFAVGAAGPAASGLPRLALKVTKLLVKLAAAYMKDLKKVTEWFLDQVQDLREIITLRLAPGCGAEEPRAC